jgi:hypothetical protein
MIKTGYRYYFPALSFSTAKLKENIKTNPAARKIIEQASAVLNQDIFRLCEKGGFFASNRECYLTTLATQVAAAKIPLNEGKNPSVFICSSFGHYAGMVFAGILSFANTLSVLSDIGATIDAYYTDYKTYCIKTSEPKSQFRFEPRLIEFFQYSFTLHVSEDGIFLTCKQDTPEDIVEMVIENNIKNALSFETVLPVRPPYHSPFISTAEQLTHKYLEELKIELPDPCPTILSTHSPSGSIPLDKGEILNTLKGFMSGPHYLDKAVEKIAGFEHLARVNIRPFARK